MATTTATATAMKMTTPASEMHDTPRRCRPKLHVDLDILHPLESSLTIHQILQLHLRLTRECYPSPSKTNLYFHATAPSDDILTSWSEDSLTWDENYDDNTYVEVIGGNEGGYENVLVDLGEVHTDMDNEKIDGKTSWWGRESAKRDVLSVVMGLGIIGGVMQWGF